MAKDHVFDDLVAQAHSASMMSEHVSPMARSRKLINTYLELLPQYLADNPDQLPDGPDPAKREEILTIKLPPMSNEGKARKEAREKDAKAAAANVKAAEEAAKEEAAKKAAVKAKVTDNGPKADVRATAGTAPYAGKSR